MPDHVAWFLNHREEGAAAYIERLAEADLRLMKPPRDAKSNDQDRSNYQALRELLNEGVRLFRSGKLSAAVGDPDQQLKEAIACHLFPMTEHCCTLLQLGTRIDVQVIARSLIEKGIMLRWLWDNPPERLPWYFGQSLVAMHNMMARRTDVSPREMEALRARIEEQKDVILSEKGRRDLANGVFPLSHNAFSKRQTREIFAEVAAASNEETSWYWYYGALSNIAHANSAGAYANLWVQVSGRRQSRDFGPYDLLGANLALWYGAHQYLCALEITDRAFNLDWLPIITQQLGPRLKVLDEAIKQRLQAKRDEVETDSHP